MRSFTVNANDAGQRLDKFVSKACPMIPQSGMYKAIRTKKIKINRKRCEISTRLCEGDVVDIYLPDDMLVIPDKDDFTAASSDIDIIYEDENILLVNKPSGLSVHEDDRSGADTLINRLKRYLSDKGEYDADSEHSFAPALCNRIDRNTDGIVIAAKNAESLRLMNEIIKEREIDKRYLCITVGTPPKDSDIITAYLYKDEKTNTVTVSDRSTPANKKIITGYTVIGTNDGLSLADIRLYTGRTHQIRAHMAHIGCPLLGDGKYGDNRINRSRGMRSQALSSYGLTFSFRTGHGRLSYLDGKSFTISDNETKRLWDKLCGQVQPMRRGTEKK
ncbi:MAG: RluA family pseudouridine synthase [Oscillospiraceae bacterium]|nr:RluA family pseudouridine synthase [Oscillospiraceae bacterium]